MTPSLSTFLSFVLLSVALAAHARESFSLAGSDWKLRADPQGRGAEETFFTADPATADWIRAKVPGNVQSDVEAAHLIKPLWYGPVNPAVYEIARKDWWYRKDFIVPASYAGQRLTLIFDGVDENCEVWLNGKPLGKNRGMFRRFAFDVSAAAVPGQTNRLAVLVRRMPENLVPFLIGSDGPESGGGPASPYWFIHGSNAMRQTLKDLKTTGTFSYDFAANVWALGIWKDVRIEATGPARIEWTRVETTLDDDTAQPIASPTPQRAGTVTVSSSNNTFARAMVHATLEISSTSGGPARANFRVRGPNADVTRTVEFTLTPGANLVSAEIPLDHPALWWPHTHGNQPLYTLEAELRPTGGGPVNDQSSARFGVRQVRWVHTDSHPNSEYIKRGYYTADEYASSHYQLMVNGVMIRGLGSSIVMSDLLPAQGGAHNRQLLHFAREAGFNWMRLNGIAGGLLDDTWYSLADELGILVSYEFPIGNAMPDNDPEFSANLDVSVRNLVKESRNHPSIIQYIGGNEMGWSRKQDSVPLQTMQKVVAEESDRLFRATDPEPDNKHSPWWFDLLQSKESYSYTDGHYKFDELKSRDGYRYYNSADSDTMWYGEFGSSSPANLEVWHREVPVKSQWPLDEVMNDPTLTYHNAVRAACDLPWLESWLFKSRIDATFGPIDNLPEFIAAGQFYGAEGLRYAFDGLRRKGRRIGGMTNHDFSEPWPNLAGSGMVDYDGRPFMNYSFVKQALAPISLSLQIDSILYNPAVGLQAELFLTSDAPTAAGALRASWLARDREGKVLDRGQMTADVSPLEVKSLGRIAVHPSGKSAEGLIFVELRLEDSSGKLLGERVQVFGVEGALKPLAGLLGKGSNPVKRTSLSVSAAPTRIAGDQEVLDLTVTNNGAMTALFCEPHPLIVYRTDLFIDNNHCFIPPGESRVITIRSARKPDCGLSLAQTGWTLSTWNADELIVAPNSDMVLAVGRWDRMSREYAGYFEVKHGTNHGETVLKGIRPDASQLPYRLASGDAAKFEFGRAVARNKPARLRIHTCDQAEKAPTVVEVTVNGRTTEKTLPAGLGIQLTDPAHRAFPATLEFALGAADLQEKVNTLTVRIKGEGWFSWDALDLVSEPSF